MPSTSAIIDVMSVGNSFPVYTWRKGGTLESKDDHLYLIIGSATDVVDKETNVLFEINPETKETIFKGNVQLLGNIAFENNTIDARSLLDHTITASKLIQNISIDGSVSRLTNKRSIDGILFDGLSDVFRFARSSSLSTVAVKTATIDSFELKYGSLVTIIFTYDNEATSISLNVSDTGTFPVYYNGSQLSKKLKKERVYQFVFDGNNWILIGELDTNDDTKIWVDVASVTDPTKHNVILTNTAEKSTSGSETGICANDFVYVPQTSTLEVGHIESRLNTGTWLSGTKQATIVRSTNASGSITGIYNYNSTNGQFVVGGHQNAVRIAYLSQDQIDTNTNTPILTTVVDESGNGVWSGTLTAAQFVGNASSATNATNDELGRNIVNTYVTNNDFLTTIDDYVPLSGGTITGSLYLPKVAGEENTIAATIGYVDKVSNNLKTEIFGDGDSYDTISDLRDLIEQNRDVIETIDQGLNAAVRYDITQTLTSSEKSRAITNIGALSVDTGGDVSGNVTADKFISRSSLDFVDNSNVCGLVTSSNTDNRSSIALTAINGDVSANVAVYVDSDNSVTTYAPTPRNSVPSGLSQTNQIATTGYVNDVVETIASSGLLTPEKTYSNIVVNDPDDSIFYFVKIDPHVADQTWAVDLRYYATGAFASYNSTGTIRIQGGLDEFTYQYSIEHNNKTFIPFSRIAYKYRTPGNYDVPNLIGLDFSNTINNNLDAFARTLTFVVEKTYQCDATFVDDPILQSTVDDDKYHNTSLTTVESSGFYTQTISTTTNNFFRIRADSTRITHNSLVARVNQNDTYTEVVGSTKPLDLSRLYFYSGVDLEPSQTSDEENVLKSYGLMTREALNGLEFTPLSRIFLFGTYDNATGAFTPDSTHPIKNAIDFSDTTKVFVEIGNEGSLENQPFLIQPITVYAYRKGMYVATTVQGEFETVELTQIDNSVATTEFVARYIEKELEIIDCGVIEEDSEESED